MDDFQEARFGEGLEDEPEESAKAYYDMLSSAQRKIFFTECKSMALGKEFSKKKSLLGAAEVALGKEAVRVDVGFFFCRVLT